MLSGELILKQLHEKDRQVSRISWEDIDVIFTINHIGPHSNVTGMITGIDNMMYEAQEPLTPA